MEFCVFDEDGDGYGSTSPPAGYDIGTDCNDNYVSSNDLDCDGIIGFDQNNNAVDCDDSDPNVGDIADDADCDGIPNNQDCDNTNPNAGLTDNDADCDGIPDDQDCDNTNPNAGLTDNDTDCDGIPDDQDCDSTNPNAGLMDNDADCDGIPDDQDCDNTNPNAGLTDNDADCDGVSTEQDCNDTNNILGDITQDNDCDGFDEYDENDNIIDCNDSNPDVYPGSNSEDGILCVFDEDGDGYGSINPPVGYDEGTDCDDTNLFVYPSMPELCGDNIDNDCDLSIDDNGSVSLLHPTNTPIDYTSSFQGSISSPATPTISSDGELHLCNGTFYINAVINSEIEIVPHGNVTLHGSDTGTVLRIDSSDKNITISDLEIVHGLGGTGLFY